MTAIKLMKGNPPDKGQVITFPKLASTKLDGIRCSIQNGRVLSYSLKPIPNKYISSILSDPRYEGLDGELISGAPNDAELTYNRTYRAVMSIEGEPDFKFYVFDTLKLADEPYLNRLLSLDSYDDLPHIVVLDQVPVYSREELDAFYEKHLELGYEGAIVRSSSGVYKHGRCTAKSQDLLKFKPLEDAEASFTVGEGDFWVTGLYEAEKNNNEKFVNEMGQSARSTHAANKVGNGMLGGFFAMSKSGVDFKIAPGKIPHAERIEIWERHVAGQPVGHDYVKFAYLPHGVIRAPRHPRATGWRSKVDL
jgi:DNA ligase-1